MFVGSAGAELWQGDNAWGVNALGRKRLTGSYGAGYTGCSMDPQLHAPESGMEYRDINAILALAQSADAKEIKKAYRRLARQFHPDMNPGDKAAESRFQGD